MTLAELIPMRADARAACLVARSGPDLVDAIVTARGQGIDPAWLSTRPTFALAWAVGSLLAPAGDLPPDAPRPATILDVRGPATPLDDVWDSLRGERGRDAASRTSGLADLAWSVACERQPEWEIPGNVRKTGNGEAFGRLWERHHRPACAYLRVRLQSQPGLDHEALVSEAWRRIFQAYWCPESERRFLGLCTLRNLVFTAAYRLALKQFPPPPCAAPRRGHPGRATGNHLPEAGDLGALLRSPSQRVVLNRCLMRLPERQAIYSFCYHLQGMPQHQIAALWSASPAAISQALAAGWAALVGQVEFREVCHLLEATRWEEVPEVH